MKISIIIPCLNEGLYISKTLRHLNNLEGDFELLAVDGGSTDDTLKQIAQFPHVGLVHSEKGRGRQMNKGAELASGEVLLFLHADTFLPEDSYRSICRVMHDKQTVAGSFYLKFDHNHPLLRFFSSCSRINLPIFTYGDSAIFVCKNIFDTLGGFKEFEFMEDVEIQKRLRRAGRFHKLSSGVTTSSRRFLKKGILRQILVDLGLVLLFKAGVSANRLKRFYRDHF